jgi:hypothetical protein
MNGGDVLAPVSVVSVPPGGPRGAWAAGEAQPRRHRSGRCSWPTERRTTPLTPGVADIDLIKGARNALVQDGKDMAQAVTGAMAHVRTQVASGGRGGELIVSGGWPRCAPLCRSCAHRLAALPAHAL